MKNWIYILYIGLMGFLASSCQSSEEEPQLPPGKVKITFTLALDNLDSRSRAEGDWTYNETNGGILGSEYENQIDFRTDNGLQVLVYSTDGQTYLGSVVNKDVVRLTNENGRLYEFTGDLMIAKENIPTDGVLNCRLMVFANCSAVTPATYANVTYSYKPTYIPMWGVQQCTLTLAEGELTRVPETIDMLRAMAKVEVKLDDNFNATLEGVSIDKHNAAGYVVPEGYYTVTNTGALFQQPVFRPLAGLGTGSLSFTGNNGTYHIYLPEYENVGEGAIPAVMTVTIDGEDYELHFKDYANDDPFNVVRNHYYQYTIMGIDKDVEVTLGELVYDVVASTNQTILVPPFE